MSISAWVLTNPLKRNQAGDVIDRVPGLGVWMAYVTQMLLDALIKHKE